MSMKETDHLKCVEEVAVDFVEGVEVEEIITTEGSSTMETVGMKDTVGGMTGGVLVEEGGDVEEAVVVTVDVVEATVVVVAAHHKNSVVIMIMATDRDACLLLDAGEGVGIGGEGVVAEDVAAAVGGILDRMHRRSKLLLEP